MYLLRSLCWHLCLTVAAHATSRNDITRGTGSSTANYNLEVSEYCIDVSFSTPHWDIFDPVTVARNGTAGVDFEFSAYNWATRVTARCTTVIVNGSARPAGANGTWYGCDLPETYFQLDSTTNNIYIQGSWVCPTSSRSVASAPILVALADVYLILICSKIDIYGVRGVPYTQQLWLRRIPDGGRKRDLPVGQHKHRGESFVSREDPATSTPVSVCTR